MLVLISLNLTYRSIRRLVVECSCNSSGQLSDDDGLSGVKRVGLLPHNPQISEAVAAPAAVARYDNTASRQLAGAAVCIS